MKIYNGRFDASNFESSSFLQINNCGIQLPAQRQVTIFREKGRVDYQLIYIVEGKCKVEYQGTTKVLHSGIVIYPPQVSQKYTDYEDTKRIWIHFNGYQVEEILKEAHLKGGIYPIGNSAIIEKMLLQLIAEHNQKATVSNEKGLLLSILNNLGKLVNMANTSESSGDKITEAIIFITTHYNNEINIKELSDSCNLSRSRFLYLFKEHTGMAPHAYQQTLRIKNSMSLLAFTKFSVAEIGRQSGYQDPLYFSRIFKKCVGMSPKEYRTQLLMANDIDVSKDKEEHRP